MKFIWFSLKLLLMLGVVAGPLAWFGYRTLTDDTRTLRTEQKRLAALQYLAALRDWTELLQQHRSASLAQLSAATGDNLPGARLAVVLDRIDAATTEMNALDAQVAPILGTTAGWHEVLDQWDDLRAYHVTRNPAESNDLHARLTARVLALARQVADNAEMPAAAERDRNALYDNLAGQRLGELDRLGAARALAAVAQSRPLTAPERGRLQALRGQYQGDRDRAHQNNQTALAGNLTLSGDLETLDIVNTVNGDAFFDLVDREVMPAEAVPSPAAFETAQKPVQASLQVYDAELDAAQRLTEAHLDQARRARKLHIIYGLIALVSGLVAAGLLVFLWSRPATSGGISTATHDRYLAALVSAPGHLGPTSSASMSGTSLPPHMRLGGSQLRQTAAEVSIDASQARLVAERLAQAADIQSQLTAATERGILSLSTNLTELTSLANDTINGSRHGVAVAQAGLQSIRGALRQLNLTREALNAAFAHVRQLASSASEVGRIAPLLDDVSEWTTLLALNASIHAANDGPTGERFALIAGHAERLASRAQGVLRDVARVGNQAQEAAAALAGLEDTGRRIADSTQSLAQVSQALAELDTLTARVPLGLSPGVSSAQDELHGAADTLQAVRDLNLSVRDSAEEARRLVATLAQLAKVGELIRGSLAPAGADSNGTGNSSSHLEDPMHPLDGSPSMIHGDMAMPSR